MDATDIVAEDATCDGDASCCGYREEKLSQSSSCDRNITRGH